MSLCVVWWQAEEARLRSQFPLEPCDDSHRQTVKLASHWRIAQIAFVNLALLYVLFGQSLDGVGFYFLEPMPYSRFLKFV
ncbi:MAG: hypothetical protein KME38_10330 [Spirirestis rafaelensis WJT71-NPBG6]|jgi:hypothetical protein|nr:hypothetical protein [Spirirestis rafaelensis WJT71-NPBG6]